MKKNLHIMLVILCSSTITALAMQGAELAIDVQTMQAVKERWQGLEEQIEQLILNERAQQGPINYQRGSVVIACFDPQARTVTTYLKNDKTAGVLLTYDQFLALFVPEITLDRESNELLLGAGLLDAFQKSLCNLSQSQFEELLDAAKMKSFVARFVAQNQNNCKVCTAKDCKKRCGGCRNVVYCSVACQQSDWPRHRAECAQAKKT